MVPDRREIKLQGPSGLRDTAPHVLTELSANLRYLRRWQEGQSDLVVIPLVYTLRGKPFSSKVL